MRTLRLGQPVGSRFEVLEGVEPGDLVVVRGNERLRPGQKVRYEGSS
jgi:multidrug efflux pump subunit AcrA (membrane-fusion protein)